MQLADLIDTPFKWGAHWNCHKPAALDCWGLANLVRHIVSGGELDPLPDYDWVYQEYTRDSAPPDLISSLIEGSGLAQKVSQWQPLDLLVVEGVRGDALFTYLGDGKAIGFSDREKVTIYPYRALGAIRAWRVN